MWVQTWGRQAAAWAEEAARREGVSVQTWGQKRAAAAVVVRQQVARPVVRAAAAGRRHSTTARQQAAAASTEEKNAVGTACGVTKGVCSNGTSSATVGRDKT